MTIPEFSVKRRITVLMLILIVALFGTVAFFQLGLDLMPEMDFPLVTVVTRWRGVASEEVEKLVTRRVEEMVSTVKDVKSVYSVSQEGVSSVVVEFPWGAQIDFAAQDVRDAVSLVKMFLPADADDPMVLKFDPSDMPVLYCAVTGMSNTMTLKKYVEDSMVPRIERLDGVAAAMALGGLKREIHVTLDTDKLSSYGLSINTVIGALGRENLNVSGGHIVVGSTEHMVRTLGEFEKLEDIRDIVLTITGGGTVCLGDVARIEDTHKEIRDYTRVNGQDCVLLMVMKQSGANTLSVVRLVKGALRELKVERPGDVEVHTVFDQGDFVEKVVSRTSVNALQGAGLAVLFILLFLRSWRPTVTISLAIPLSVLTIFIGMYAMGYTFNLLTLGGIALGVGMLVDNAVVVIENTFRHLEEGEDSDTAAARGASEVGTAITASTFTTMAVFLPMVLVGGLAGILSRPIALTVCLALLASLFVAITLVPAMASVFFRGSTAAEYRRRFEGKGFEAVKSAYGGTLRWVLSHRAAVLLGVVVLFAASVVGVWHLGFEFMPEQDVPMAFLSMKLPVGTTLEETNRVVRRIEAHGRSLPEARFVMTMIGSSELSEMDPATLEMGLADVNAGMVMLRMTDKLDRERSSKEIIDDIRANIPPVKGAECTFFDMSSGMMTTGAEHVAIAVRIFGKEIPVLKRLADEAAAKMRTVEGLRDVQVGFQAGKPELHVRIDRERAVRYGLSVAQVAPTIKAALLGQVATRYRVGGDEYDVRVRFEEDDRDTLGKMRDISILTSLGTRVPLSAIAEVTSGTGPLQIAREHQERKIVVTASLLGRDVGSAVAEIKEKLSLLRLPSGYHIDYGGAYKDMEVTFRALAWALVVAIILIYMVMAALFESLVQPFVVMFTLPLAAIGVIGGLFLFGMTLSTTSFIGGIILVGIVVNNAIVMIDLINRLRREGRQAEESIVQGAVMRLRPILITSFTTILGILPMGLSRSEGSEMRGPMGVAIASGLLFGMCLTLLVIPVVLSVVDDVQHWMRPQETPGKVSI